MDEGSSAIGEGALVRGRGAAGRWEWAEAYAALLQADDLAAMGPADLELLAVRLCRLVIEGSRDLRNLCCLIGELCFGFV